MTTETLHACFNLGLADAWLEEQTDWEFTKRIKYTRVSGIFHQMFLEIELTAQERRWFSFWKKTPTTFTKWVAAESFDYRPTHKKILEETITECET